VNDGDATRAQGLRNRLLALEEQEKANRQLYMNPETPLPEHVAAYFMTFDNILEETSRLQLLGSEHIQQVREARQKLTTHRDSMGSLMALAIDLRVSLEGALNPVNEELQLLRAETTLLTEEVRQLKDQLSSFKKIR